MSAALVRTRLRADRTSLLALFALVAVTSFLFAAAPLFFDRAADTGLQGALARGSVIDRSLEFRHWTWIEPTSEEPLSGAEAAGIRLEDDLSARLRSAVSDRQLMVASSDYLIVDAPRPISRLQVRYQTGIEERIRLLEGRAASAETRTIEVPNGESPDDGPTELIVSDVAISRETADTLAVGVGDRLLLAMDANPASVAVDVVGIFEILEPDADYWLNDKALQAPLVERVGLDLRIYHATALVAPGSLVPSAGEQSGFGQFDGMTLRHSWRFFLDPQRIDSDDLDALTRDLVRLETQYPFRASEFQAEVASLSTGLPQVIQTYEAQRRASEGALAVAATGPAGAAAGALALVAVLLARRRRAGAELVQGRGGSSVDLVGAQLLEGLLVAVPAAALGLCLAILLFGSAGSVLALAAACGVAAGTVLILVTASLRGERTGPAMTREMGVTLRPQPRRLVFDLLVVALAAAGVTSLLQRGLVGAATGASGDSFDAYLAAVPVLVGLAAGLIVQRLYPLPVRILAWLSATLRSLVPALALRSAARDRTGGQLPLVVLMLATAMGVFASVLLVSVERAQEETSWREFGADYRIEARVNELLPAGLEVASVTGVEATSIVYRTAARLRGGTVRALSVTLEALDAATYPGVVAGTPADISLPAAFSRGSWSEATAGTREDPVPAIVSRSIAQRTGVGETGMIALTLPGGEIWFRIVEVRDGFAGVAPGRPFAVAPLAGVAAAISGPSVGRWAVYVRAPPSAEAGLGDAAASYGSTIAIDSRHDRFAALQDAPLMDAVDIGFGLALITALGYAGLCLAAGLALALAARQRQLALLRIMGVRRRDFVVLLLTEHAPVVAVGLLGGVALGLFVSWLIVPGLGLQVFAATSSSLPVVIDLRYVVLLGIAPVAVVAGAVLAGAWLVQRADVSGAIRWTEP